MTNTNQQTASHTPGPWKVSFLDTVIAGNRLIADCESDKKNQPKAATPEDMANANLIAAAPELLEALTDIRIAYNGVLNELAGEDSNYCDNAKYSSLLQKVDRAIAKSEGRA